MFRSDFGSRVSLKKWFDVLAGRTNRKAGRSKAFFRGSRPHALLAVEQLEGRINPAPALVAASFFDSALYEFNPVTGALETTLIAPYSSSMLSGPAGMTVGPDGNLYISSQFNNTILQYNLTTNKLSPFISSTDLQNIAGENGDAQFAPSGLRFGPDGNLYVSLNGGQSSSSGGAVVRFSAADNAGTLSYIEGSATTIATGLIQPSGLAFGTASGDANNLYVANSAVQDVVKITNAPLASPTSSTFIPSGTGGMNYPTAVAWGPDGELYVVDLGATSFQGNVLQFNPDGSFSKIVTSTDPSDPGDLLYQFPSDVLFDGQGHMLTANLGSAYPPNLAGSINQYDTDGSFDQTLVSSSQFPDTGPGTSGISPSQLALLPNAVTPGPFSKYVVEVQGGHKVVAGNSFLVTVQAADQYGNAVTSYSGPSSVNATISPTSAASNFPQTVSINSFGLGFFLGNLQTVGTYTITVGVGSPPMAPMGNAPPVTVTAGQAVKLAFLAQPSPPPPQPPASIPTGITLPAVTVAIEDAYGNPVTSDSTDNVTLGLAAGAPGVFLAGSMTTEQAHNGIATFNNLTLVAPGSYTLSDIVPGSYIGPNSNSFNIAPLQVSSFTPSPAGSAFASGFALTFNAPFLVNTTILNPLGGANVPALYGSGFGASGIVPSVTLTQTSGQAPNGFKLPYQVAGSVVLNPATYSLTFIPTNNSSYLSLNGTPVLPDGTYVVDVAGKSAGVTGFQAFNAGGGYLAGNMPNGDWTTTFTVGASAAKDEVVWLPATAIGPGQPLEAPGYTLSGGGEPIYLYDPSTTPGQPGDVTSVTGTLTYNPNYLTVTSGMGGPYLTITQTATPGVATFAYNGPPVTFNGANGLNIHNTGIASTPLGYLNWSGALAQLSNPSLGSVVGAPGGNMTGGTNGTTYYYELASVANGMVSPASTVVSVTLPANDTGESVLLDWPQDLVATGYNLYRTTTTVGGVPQFTTASLLAANIPYSLDPNFGYQYLDTTAPGATLMTGALPPSATSFAQATVPNGTVGSPLSIYQGKDVLTVSNVVVKTASQTLPSIGNSAVHLVAYEGDADGNGVYTSGGDSVELTRVHLGTDSGFPAYPLIDPVILGDVDNPDLGNFSGDAAFQISILSVGATPNYVAPAPTSVQVSPGGQAPFTILPVGNGDDPTLTLPSNLQLGADGTVVVPVNIDDACPAGSTGLVEADLALTYNPSLFTVSASDVHAGSVLADGNWSVVPNIDQATGEIGIALSSSMPVRAPTGGSLVTIDFHPTGAGSGQARFELVASVTPNGQYVMTELEDTQGTFTLTPAPTNGFDPRIDGMATLTANAGAVVGAPVLIAPVEFHDPVSSMVDTAGAPAPMRPTSEETTTPNSPAVVPESGEQAVIAGPSALAETTTEHAFGVATAPGRATVLAATSALVSTGVGTLAAPLASWTFLVGPVPSLIVPGTGIRGGQHLADQVFQTLGTGTINPTIFATVKDIFERVIAGQLMLLPCDADILDSLRNETSDFDGPGIALGGRRARGELTAHPIAPPTVIQNFFANRDALDRYFAQAADDAEQGTGDE